MLFHYFFITLFVSWNSNNQSQKPKQLFQVSPQIFHHLPFSSMDNPWIPAFWNSSTDYPFAQATPGPKRRRGGAGGGQGWGGGEEGSLVLRSWMSLNLAGLAVPPADMFCACRGIRSLHPCVVTPLLISPVYLLSFSSFLFSFFRKQRHVGRHRQPG